MSSPNFKVAFVWWPKRLAVHHEDGWDFIGWVWLQRAYLTHNLQHGWIAFVKNQTPQMLDRCPRCGK